MSVILANGVIKSGRVEVAEPIDLPDGTEVSLVMAKPEESEVTSDEAWDNTPEGIADWLKWCDSLEPLILTAEEEADSEAYLRQMNAYGAAKLAETGESLFK